MGRPELPTAHFNNNAATVTYQNCWQTDNTRQIFSTFCSHTHNMLMTATFHTDIERILLFSTLRILTEKMNWHSFKTPTSMSSLVCNKCKSI